MQLIVKEVAGKRQWIPVMNDDEMYEVLCNCMAWRACHNEKIGFPEKALDQIRTAVVVIAKRARDEDETPNLEKIQDPFIRLVLTECNRLGIDLPN